MTWTQFWDMKSGGTTKIRSYNKIYVERPMDEAIEFFEQKFYRNPYHVTCSCCGEDYAVDEFETLEEATKWHRNINVESVDEFTDRDPVLVIDSDEVNQTRSDNE